MWRVGEPTRRDARIFDGLRTETGEYKVKRIVSAPSAKANEGKKRSRLLNNDWCLAMNRCRGV